MTEIPSKEHFVFVHGAMHGAWCWYKIRSRLESAGYRVSCLDLSSAGIDRSDPDSTFTFNEYDIPLTDFMSALPEDDKVILVGHSAGGLSVTHAIKLFKQKVRLAIYVCAQMLQTDVKVPPDVSVLEVMYDLGFGLGPDKPPTSIILKKEFQRESLYHLSPIEDSTLASMLLRPLPTMPIREARSERGDLQGVKAVYIKTLYDRRFKPEDQDDKINRWSPDMVLTMESEHSPFFSAPDQLVTLLLQALASTITYPA